MGLSSWLSQDLCLLEGQWRKGWKAEYSSKVPNATHPNATQPMAAPHPVLPSLPRPLPTSVTVATGNTIWYVSSYKKGWDEGKSRGYSAGEQESKASGKIARERGDDFRYAYTTGYAKGYDDSSAGLAAAHGRGRRGLNNNQPRRKLRGFKRQLAQHFTNGYSKGYAVWHNVCWPTRSVI
jgi:hypothetical protein